MTRSRWPTLTGISGWPTPARFWLGWGFRIAVPVSFVIAFAGLIGCSVRAPGSTETAIMTTVKRRVTVGGANDKNPVPPTPENIQRGQQAFSAYCAACHGLDGQTTGVPFAAAMSPPVPELTSHSVQAYTDGQLKYVITNGLSPSGMPASKGILRDEEVWEIVTYLRHLPPKGSLGEPSMYSGDAGSKR